MIYSLGKTTICQLISSMNNKPLHIINCHMHSEAADFVGNIRPVRESNEKMDENEISKQRLFEWQDGPLITAMRQGGDILIDEISLAEDSVLERLNSVLEPERSLLLSENSSFDHSDVLYAHKSFRIFATMNPSGDFGKKELSTALRNRFLEIWCNSIKMAEEIKMIINSLLENRVGNEIKEILTEIICNFIEWLRKQPFFHKNSISIRDVVLWISFINKVTDENYLLHQNINSMTLLNPFSALIHGANLIFIDSLSSETLMGSPINNLNRELCIDFLFETTNKFLNYNIKDVYYNGLDIFYNDEKLFKCGPFYLSKKPGTLVDETNNSVYHFNAPTTSKNLMRLMRCLVLDSPIMLEGR